MTQKKNKEQDRSEQEPLLYITQPQFPKASTSMQQSFIIKPKVKKDETETEEVIKEKQAENILQQEVSEIAGAAKEQVRLQQDIHENLEEDEQHVHLQEEEAGLPFVPSAAIEAAEVLDEHAEVQAEQEEVVRKSFKDLDTKQKIHYLLHRPHYIPKVLCEIKTQTGSHIGYVISFENEVVVLRSYNTFTPVKISYQDITDIQMRML